MKIWDKGYTLDQLIEEFTVDQDHVLDRQLLPYDCTASAAHAWMLERAGILTPAEAEAIAAVLAEIRDEVEQGSHEIPRELEDCHAYLEYHLTKRLGDLGKKIHTARSRNDQVLTALRLLYRDRLKAIAVALDETKQTLRSFGVAWTDTPLPGYTHMRKAMPSSIRMWAEGFADGFHDDRALLDAVAAMIDQCPAGTGAGFGIPMQLDRAAIAVELGFGRVQENPVYAQLSRGKFEAAILSVISQILLGINRFAADLIMFSMPEFGYFRLPAAFCTGSSIMPQKKNPDVLELLRGKYHEAISLEMRVKGIVASLPSGYNRDVQLTKEPVLRGLHLGLSCLRVTRHLVIALEVDEARCADGMTADLFATKRVYELVAQGVPFREAYRRVAQELG